MGRRGYAFCLIFSVSVLTAGSASAQAYVGTVTTNSVPVRWKGNPQLNLAGNPTNRSGIDAGSFRNAVVRSLQRWKQAGGGRIGFDYWQGTDASAYEPDSDFNGLSSVYFISNAKSDPHLSSNVLGLTQVWYNTDSGQILETDVVLNDRDFHFTTNPQDTSGYGSGNVSNFSAGRSSVYIENVLTHELGHALGLSHSGGLQSTMLFMESPEQAHLACDDNVGIRALYPAGDAAARGAITGLVTSESGSPLVGAHVLAISRRRGAVLATAVTDRSGRYRLDALETGDYFLMVEPFFAGSTALPAYYSSVSSAVCPGGANFGRSILRGSDGSGPLTLTVSAGGALTAPNLIGKCEGGGAALVSNPASGKSVTAATIYDGASGASGFGAAEGVGYSGAVYYRIKAVSGHLEVHGMSYSLYSPVHSSLALIDASGSVVSSARTAESVYEGDSGYINFDTALVAEGLPIGDYTLKVTVSAMDSTRYPAGQVSLDSVPFLLITGSVNEAGPPLAASLPVNARCRADENYAAYSSPGGNPPRSSTDTSSDSGSGFCGTIADSNRRGGGGTGPGPGAMVGWLVPWMAMALIAQLSKRWARSVASAALS